MSGSRFLIVRLVKRDQHTTLGQKILFRPVQGSRAFFIDWNQGRRASRLPLAFIDRAFGAPAGLQRYLCDVDHVLALVGDEEFVG
jgi:hypothetical protein